MKTTKKGPGRPRAFTRKQLKEALKAAKGSVIQAATILKVVPQTIYLAKQRYFSA
jgi:transcriptional regulator with GAF, ATPase, and Fis domain